MLKNAVLFLFTSVFLLVLICPQSGLSQKGMRETKEEHYERLAREAGIPTKMAKPTGFLDRKKALLDYGKIRTEVQNTNLMGYSRVVKAFEFPKGSNIHYQWCQGLFVAGKLSGEKRVLTQPLEQSVWQRIIGNPLADTIRAFSTMVLP